MSQTKHVKEMLKKFKMEYCKPVNTPMVTSFKLSKDDESSLENMTLYRLIIYSLFHVTSSRLDIMHIVGMLIRIKLPPKKNHVKVAKIILKYFKVTLDFGLCYLKRKNFSLTTYTNVN